MRILQVLSLTKKLRSCNALIDEANNRVIYVLTSYPDPEHLKEYSDFLKNDPKAYDLGNTSTLDRFCIYSVKMIDFDGYVEYDEE